MEKIKRLILVTTTVETIEQADELASFLISQSLAACVQIDGPVTSHYRWAGKVQQTVEYRLLAKSCSTTWPKLRDEISKRHPYDEPEIIMTIIDDASDGYRDWVIDQTS